MAATVEKSPGPGRRVLPSTGATQYLEATDPRGVMISVHTSAMLPGHLLIVGVNRSGDYRPPHLDAAGVRQLRDALDLALEDLQSPSQENSG